MTTDSSNIQDNIPRESVQAQPNDSQPNAESITAQTASAGKHYYAFLIAYLVVLSALGSFMNDMYTPALPGMCRFFNCPISLAQLGMTMGMIGLGVGQFLLGPISDRYGRKPVLAASLLLFIGAAVGSIWSPNIHIFNAWRFLQGCGAAGGYFLARTIPADVTSGRSLARMMAIIGAINGIAPASAPVIGGVTADAWGWRGIFILLAVFAGLILCFSKGLKESLSPDRRTKGHWWTSIRGYGQLLTNRPFMIHVTFKGAALGLLFSYISTSPFILQTHYGLSQTVYGCVIGFNALFVAAGSMTALRFHPLKRAAGVGASIVACGTAAQAAALWMVHSLWLFEVCIVVMLFGLGLIFATTNTLAMNEGRARAGEASAVLGISGYIFGAIGAPLVGLGNILHSSAIVFVAFAIGIAVCAYGSHTVAPDLDK